MVGIDEMKFVLSVRCKFDLFTLCHSTLGTEHFGTRLCGNSNLSVCQRSTVSCYRGAKIFLMSELGYMSLLCTYSHNKWVIRSIIACSHLQKCTLRNIGNVGATRKQWKEHSWTLLVSRAFSLVKFTTSEILRNFSFD